MEVNAKKSKGFTLVEALVALVILAILLLGLLAGLLTAVRYNLVNNLRDEAKNIALECAENIRNSDFTSLTTGSVSCEASKPVVVSSPCTDIGTRISASTPEMVRRKKRNAEVNYTIGWDISGSGNVRQVRITVCWTYAGRSYSHSLTTLVSRETSPGGGS